MVSVWWHEAMARVGWGDATVAREWGRIAETRWRGVTGSGSRWVGSGQVMFAVVLIGVSGKMDKRLSVCIVFVITVKYSCNAYLSKHVAVY
jgi:hypothetical protein